MKIIPKRKLHYPFAMECDYTKLLTNYVKDCMAIVRSYIPEMRKLVTEQSEPGATSVNVYLDLLIDRIRHDMPQTDALEGRMRRFFDEVAHFTWRDLKRLLESVVGTQISGRGARLSRKDADDDLDALKELWVSENLDLIRSIDDETMRRIRQILTARITGSVNHAGLAKDLIAEIQAITEKEKSRAELIARDQLGKLHGQINRRKQESLGIDEYEWETSHDERVRDSHRALQGKVFSWNKPPPEGHPGYPIRCRCIALPVIDWDRQLGEPEKGSYKDVQNVAPQATNAAGALNAVVQSGKITVEQELRANATKLQASMLADDYNEYINLLKDNETIAPLYTQYADGISLVKNAATGGYYDHRASILEWSYPDAKHIATGRHKYHTLAHEYGHLFDRKLPTSKLTFKELDAVNAGVLKISDYRVSFSDEFLAAMRADKVHLRKTVTSTVKSEFRARAASAGVQDAIDGLFVNARIRWGHGEAYYNRIYNNIKKWKYEKNLKQVYESLGFDASNQTKVKSLCRCYEAASETWANIASAVTCGGEELEYIKKYLPNSYQAFMEILEKVKP